MVRLISQSLRDSLLDLVQGVELDGVGVFPAVGRQIGFFLAAINTISSSGGVVILSLIVHARRTASSSHFS